jgi:exonuclease III
MRLLTLNVWEGRLKGKLIPFIAGSAKNTDIFCFQEILEISAAQKARWRKTVKFGDSFAKGTAANGKIFSAARGALKGFSPFLSEPYTDGNLRLATFVSRKERVVSNEIHPLQVEHRQRALGADLWTKPILQHTRITKGGRQYNILNFHGLWVYKKWHSDTPERLEQSQAIIDFISGLKGRTILCGDFNLKPNTESLRMLEESGLRNLVKEFGIKSTRPKEYWSKRDKFADYILISKDVKVNTFRVLDAAVSDHLPLYLDFQ